MDQTVRVKFLHVNKMLWRGQRGEKSKTLVQFPYKMLFVSLARRLSSAMNRCTFRPFVYSLLMFYVISGYFIPSFAEEKCQVSFSRPPSAAFADCF